MQANELQASDWFAVFAMLGMALMLLVLTILGWRKNPARPKRDRRGSQER